jgi:hypothetical protein
VGCLNGMDVGSKPGKLAGVGIEMKGSMCQSTPLRPYDPAMGSRRHLASVAEGTSRSFASRNNDVDGWWAPGLLLAASRAADPDFQVDLMTGESTPTLGEQGLDALGPAWSVYFHWSLERHGLSAAVVRSATLTVRFNRTAEVPSWIRGRRDRPFHCTVTIEDDRGRSYMRVVESHCFPAIRMPLLRRMQGLSRSGGPYDPGRVRRRTQRPVSVSDPPA